MNLGEAVIFELNEYEIITQTDKAGLLRFEGQDWWIPKSQYRILNNKLYIALWFYNKLKEGESENETN